MGQKIQEFLINQYQLILEAIKTNKKVKKLWFFGTFLIVISVISKMFMLALAFFGFIIFLTYGNMGEDNEKFEDEEEDVITGEEDEEKTEEEKEEEDQSKANTLKDLYKQRYETKELYEDLKEYADQNNITLEDRKEIKKLELELKNINDEIKKLKENNV